MKKILLLITSFVAFNTVSSQTTLFEDAFDDLSKWDNTDLTAVNGTNGIWTAYSSTTSTLKAAIMFGRIATNDGLPEEAELKLKTALDLSTNSHVYLRFFQQFQYETNTTGDGKVEVSDDGGTTWSTVLTVKPTQAQNYISAGTQVIDISTYVANKSNVQVRFLYTGNNSGYWLIDDLEIYEPLEYDVQVYAINNAVDRNLGTGQVIDFSFYNRGWAIINDLEVEFRTSPTATPEVLKTTGLSVNRLTTANTTESLSWDAQEGFYNTTVTAIKINNNAIQNTMNNSTTKLSVVYGSSAEPRVPLYEVFTSSTCGPCRSGNEQLHSIIDSKDESLFNVLKYQQNFPGTGDPYATDETVARRDYYGVNSIPRMEIDGGWDQSAISFTNAVYTSSQATKSFFDLSGEFEIDKDNQEINITSNIKSLFSFFSEEFLVHYAVVETLNTKNVKSNGETKFEQVVKKMLPDENGTLLESIDNKVLNAEQIEHSIKFKANGSYRLPADAEAANRINLDSEHTIENFDNLYVIMWVESKSGKVVLQSKRLEKKEKSTAATYTIIADSAHEVVYEVTSADVDNKEVKAYYMSDSLSEGDSVKWEVTSVEIPSEWEFVSVCDHIECIPYTFGINSVFTFKDPATADDNLLKADFKHNKVPGYGYAIINTYRLKDPTNSASTFKASLLTTESASITLTSDINDKLLYFFDNNVFVDRDFKGATLEIFDMNGRKVMTQEVVSDHIKFEATRGMYIANVVKEGEVVKSIKFDVSK